jgi:hypothetical protein
MRLALRSISFSQFRGFFFLTVCILAFFEVDEFLAEEALANSHLPQTSRRKARQAGRDFQCFEQSPYAAFGNFYIFYRENGAQESV